MSSEVTIKVFRYNPELDKEPLFETFKIPYKEGMKVLDALKFIRDRCTTDLAFRYSCRDARCGTCGVMVNGKPALACRKNVEKGKEIIITPLPYFPIIKDLVIDRGKVDNKFLRFRPSLERKSPPQSEPEILVVKWLHDWYELDKCIDCLCCVSSCPVVKETHHFAGPASLVNLAFHTYDPRDYGLRTPIAFFEGLYDCTTCRACTEVCPKSIDIPGKAIEKLRTLSVGEGLGPLEGHIPFIESIRKTGRAVVRRATPLLERVPETVDVKDPVDDVAFFTGCLIDYIFQQNGLNIIKVLKQNRVRVHVPKHQTSCASPAWRAGVVDLGTRQAERNIEIFERLGIEKIIAGCAGCTSTMKLNWPAALKEIRGEPPSFRAYDFTEYLVNELGVENLNKELGEIPMVITYHDPCHLNRGQGIKEEPRQIINLIPGVKFIEMDEPDRCCGAGGGVRSGRKPLSMAIAQLKAQLIINSGAEACVTECPFCHMQIQDALRQLGSEVKVYNVADLLAMSYSTIKK